MKRDERLFFNVFRLITALFLLLSLAVFYFATTEKVNILRITLLILTFVFIFISIITALSIFIIHNIVKGKKISRLSSWLIKKVLTIIYPLLVYISDIFKIDIDSIRRVFANVNNFLVMTKNIKVDNNEILILLPHCLQSSECPYKITTDINNCRMCGKCDIKDIINLCNRYNVTAVVATGGTLARQWIKKMRPKAIIAVACERDLCSGINDVRVLPVLGVINKRPNGPCFDTKVDVTKLEEAIKFFIKEDK
ncbi:DUF116 domain-containing protein [Caldisalinibacter kiritimatiensis]|uniref:DUF116 domain-containing protein n=1 Tax=Caldisalinibacter kiritimatiensis TaxID=1304284 RepID=R1CG71_9FIRM|nr:DUF116 domain-containing protein [Caldisalinibacter kiritimatiensis]EOD01315.1 hypothetical protein L21TH_0669 [Caldisalinibacter kiritimatiensis]